VDMPKVIRNTIRDIGYTDASYGFDYHTAGVIVSIKEQSTDIQMGVDRSLEARSGGSDDSDESTGAGDQGMMIGFACNETPEYMPATISLAHKLCRRLSNVRRDGTLGYLRPDGKSQVTIEYSYGKPVRVDCVVVAAQHDEQVDHATLQHDIVQEVIRAVIPGGLLDEGTRFLVNPTGRFCIGGPMGDAGLTGRKIIVDTYGGAARHGGGAFSGKDPTKVDRSAAYAARYVAKNIVAAGIAERFEIQVAYAIGVAHPVSITFETFGTAKIPDERILKLIECHFDLRPAAIIRDLDLRRPIYRQTAAYGHFGRDDLDVPWERTHLAGLLRQEAGI
ncbi:MAG TPA: methionine adenosyltransferase, partial [Chloroflexota bacterium]|nr:methionine adenosyltransferase [Chloroflexota bacterium]